jgi:hypothetical protein
MYRPPDRADSSFALSLYVEAAHSNNTTDAKGNTLIAPMTAGSKFP